MRGADAARDRRDLGAAVSLYRDITRDFPEYRAAWVQLGNMAKDSGDFQLAERVYSHALVLDPDDADVPLQLGHLAKLQGDFGAALLWYEKALAIDPAGAAGDELAALGFRRRIEDLRNIDEDPHALDLPDRALLVHQRLAVAFKNRRL